MRNDTTQNRLNLDLNRPKIPDNKLAMGSTKDKYPIVLDDGRTVVFISDKSKEAAIRLKYQLLKENKLPEHNP